MSKFFDKEIGLLSSQKRINKYIVYKLTNTYNSVTIHYFVDDWSSAWITDQATFNKFPQKFKVMSGGWYGDKGRWKTLKRIIKEIKCDNIVDFSEKTYKGENSISFNKKSFSNKIEVNIKSEKVGNISFKCEFVDFTDFYQLLAFDNKQDKFIDATHLFDGGLTFIGTL